MALDPGLERICAHLGGVTGAVADKADEVAMSARRNLAQHRETGGARITVTRDDVDSLVSLVDPAAVTIEYGRNGSRGRGRSRGLFILSREL